MGDFQRRHYEQIADAIAKARVEAVVEELDGVQALRFLSMELALLFSQDNPNFDPSKFLTRIAVNSVKS